jgi:hypothetical protein
MISLPSHYSRFILQIVGKRSKGVHIITDSVTSNLAWFTVSGDYQTRTELVLFRARDSMQYNPRNLLFTAISLTFWIQS